MLPCDVIVTADVTFNLDVLDYGALLNDLALAMILSGIVLLAVSFLGCCSACCNFTTLALPVTQ